MRPEISSLPYNLHTEHSNFQRYLWLENRKLGTWTVVGEKGFAWHPNLSSHWFQTVLACLSEDGELGK